MNRRTTQRSMRFTKAFVISGVERMQPAGTYAVEFDDEFIEGISFQAYRRVATRLRLADDPARPGITEIVEVTSAEISAGLEVRGLANGEEQPRTGGE